MLKLGAAAAKLGVSQSTLRRWLQAGQAHGIKLGRQWMIREAEIERLLREGCSLP